MTDTAPIGVFDSGMGGLSVVATLHNAMPSTPIRYIGDSAFAPYGTKTVNNVAHRCFAICDQLVQEGCQAIIVACNTATSSCINDLRQRYNIPIIGMEPALKVACERGNGVPQRIIVAATPLTLHEKKFANLAEHVGKEHTIFKQPCPDLVELVEHDQLDNRAEVMATLHRYFDVYDFSQIDSLVLGCTHFLFFKDYFRELLPAHIAIIDGNHGTVQHCQDLLQKTSNTNSSAVHNATKSASELENSEIQNNSSAHLELPHTITLDNITISNTSSDKRYMPLSQKLLEHIAQQKN